MWNTRYESVLIIRAIASVKYHGLVRNFSNRIIRFYTQPTRDPYYSVTTTRASASNSCSILLITREFFLQFGFVPQTPRSRLLRSLDYIHRHNILYAQNFLYDSKYVNYIRSSKNIRRIEGWYGIELREGNISHPIYVSPSCSLWHSFKFWKLHEDENSAQNQRARDPRPVTLRRLRNAQMTCQPSTELATSRGPAMDACVNDRRPEIQARRHHRRRRHRRVVRFPAVPIVCATDDRVTDVRSRVCPSRTRVEDK